LGIVLCLLRDQRTGYDAENFFVFRIHQGRLARRRRSASCFHRDSLIDVHPRMPSIAANDVNPFFIRLAGEPEGRLSHIGSSKAGKMVE
jgi:hypothetical protein